MDTSTGAAIASIALTFAGLITNGIKIMSFAKFIDAQDWEAARWQATAWGISILLVLWGAHIVGIRDTAIGDVPLRLMDIPTQIFVGLSLGSTGSFIYDRTVARDDNRTSKI